MENELAVRKAPELSMEVIRKYICPAATDQEAFTFLQLCNAQGLNPFLKEAYLVKYGSEAATIITGKDTFTKRADRLVQYDGFKAGIIVQSNNQVVHREGSFVVAGETLLGGWAEVFRKDRGQSFRNEVSLAEYERRKKDGSLMSNWRTMPATMIRKVALVQSLREAFPDEFGGMYSPEEMPVDAAALPVYSTSSPPAYPAPDPGKPAVREPQKTKEKASPSADAETARVKIVSVGSKNGKDSKGKDYTIYAIFDEADVKYGTFDAGLADLARSAKENGSIAKITYVQGKFGNKITNLEIEPEDKPTEAA